MPSPLQDNATKIIAAVTVGVGIIMSTSGIEQSLAAWGNREQSNKKLALRIGKAGIGMCVGYTALAALKSVEGHIR